MDGWSSEGHAGESSKHGSGVNTREGIRKILRSREGEKGEGEKGEGETGKEKRETRKRKGKKAMGRLRKCLILFIVMGLGLG